MERIVTFQDSFGHGYHLGGLWPEDVGWSHQYYPIKELASLQGMAELIFRENKLPVQWVYSWIPANTSNFGAAVDYVRQSGILRPYDTVVVTEAGDHSMVPSTHEALMLGVRQAIIGQHPNKLIMTNMFDYDFTAFSGGQCPALNARWSTIFSGQTRTMNDATLAAFNDATAIVGTKTWVDIKTPMDTLVNSMMSHQSGPVWPVLHDGIHPGVYGGLRLLGTILAATPWWQYIVSSHSIQKLCADNYNLEPIRGYSPYSGWSAAYAAEWARIAFGK